MEPSKEDICLALFSEKPGTAIAAFLARSARPKAAATAVFEVLVAGHQWLFGGEWRRIQSKLPTDAQKQSEESVSWLFCAEIEEIKSVINTCLAAGASVDFVDDESGKTLLFMAIESGRHEVWEFVLSKEPSLDAIRAVQDGENVFGMSPLISAGWKFQEEDCHEKSALVRLLDLGANPNGTDVFGRTALFHVAQLGVFDAADIIVAKGGLPMHLDKWGNTMLHDHVMDMSFCPGDEEFAETVFTWMIRNGVDPNHLNEKGRNAYDLIESEGGVEVDNLIAAMLKKVVANHQARQLDDASIEVSRAKSSPRL